MEGFHTNQFDRIIGATEIENQKAKKQLDACFREGKQEVLPFEIRISGKDRELIKEIESDTDDVVAHYGGTPTSFPDSQIHILRPGSVVKLTRGVLRRGFHAPLEQYVAVERGPSAIQFALDLTHELLHLKSPKVARVTDGGDITLYRSGIKMVDRKDESQSMGKETIYFAELEEAIVAELTDQLYREKISIDPQFRDEMHELDRIKPWIKKMFHEAGRTTSEWQDETLQGFRAVTPKGAADLLGVLDSKTFADEYKLKYLAGRFTALMEEGELGVVERYGERENLRHLLNELIQRNSQHGKEEESKQELFDEFARANFTGNYLTLARIIEGRMGKGAFRRLAEKSRLGSHATSWW